MFFLNKTQEEVLTYKTGFKMSTFELKRAKYAKLRNTLKNNITVKLPTSLDWRAHGLVTSVKYQGYCGACWAFAAAGALEGQYLKKLNKTARNFDASLSSEYFLDCDNNNWGCSGGDFAQCLFSF
jgi:C1A family cysteine protease